MSSILKNRSYQRRVLRQTPCLIAVNRQPCRTERDRRLRFRAEDRREIWATWGPSLPLMPRLKTPGGIPADCCVGNLPSGELTKTKWRKERVLTWSRRCPKFFRMSRCWRNWKFSRSTWAKAQAQGFERLGLLGQLGLRTLFSNHAGSRRARPTHGRPAPAAGRWSRATAQPVS